MDFVELDGVGLRYELSGTGDRTLVLVHEMGGSLESWDGVAPRFAESRRVLRYDTRGAGLSQKVRGPRVIAQYAARLCEPWRDVVPAFERAAHFVHQHQGAVAATG